ncbi:peptidoglycan DD-metalloendopeptidase family protein [Garicola koreensis]|uniref:Murein DD-endopeptidase MepM/ murein hydrolase activator NlpD n=1 Tax=Garicola koreensis TaxID=1262554 RepID=A0A7W5TUG6_9MICC|nr:murein DD-endopeptidase MepM/ murein hydrolase activator NlpD [Garicola koreensis]
MARARDVLLLLALLLGLFGAPPATPVMAQADSGTWVRPADGAVTDGFSAPPVPWARGHRGIDLASSTGTQIRSPADGVASFSGVVVDREVLSVNHGGGYISSFEPVESDLQVGDTLTGGETVAELSTYDDGSAHCDSPCLHWGVRLHGEYINPLLLTGELEPSVLLPLHNR